jgi:hypothetical protein
MKSIGNWKDFVFAGMLFTFVIGTGLFITSCGTQAVPSASAGGNATATPTPGGTGTTLGAGDVAFVGYASRNANVQDQFAAVILKPITTGTVIIFTTANALQNGTGFQSTESNFTWVASQNFPAGSVFEIFDSASFPVTVYANGTAYNQSSAIINNNGFSLSKNGDNIFAIQGSLTNPTFLAGIVAGGNGLGLTWGGTDDNGRVEYLPPSLTNGTTANSLGNTYSIGYYNCSATTTGAEAVLDAAINDGSTHWTGLGDTSNTDLPQGADVLSCSIVVN